MLPKFTDGYAAQYYVGHGAEFGEEVRGGCLQVRRVVPPTEREDTIHGLAAPCGRATRPGAARVVTTLRLGAVWINDYHPYVPQAEWGGFKQSGFGRELGSSGLTEFRVAKHIWRWTNPSLQGWFA
ncbi:hypothetical protein ADL12_22325 [Streptomyces regalis]|uniref:Aldehyde dehydrogenase domain-containing protein n=1 Tax=Streptomyces regalis TaxID=68262 RepID=A0A101JTL6_9ACTN|nr:hypothetical protein ADL12_22325 [Streptomyces regalis]